MKTRSLPKPEGRYHVGTGSYELVDSDRPAKIGSEEFGRRIFIKFWYPADAAMTDSSEPEELWSQLREEAKMSGIARLLLRRAMRTRTNSHLDVPISNEVSQPQVLIYNHGMISFASENTMLMEHLASYGYVVLSLQHVDQLSEFRALEQQLPDELKKKQALMLKKIKTATGQERAELSSHYFRMAENTNRITAERAADIEYATTHLGSVLDSIPGLKTAERAKVVGVIGLSLGGAVATEYARTRPVSCVVNMDGGIFGKQLDVQISQAYLMVYSQHNSGANDLVLGKHANRFVKTESIEDTKHLNLHDISFIYPVLKWLKVTGRANPAEVIRQRNRLVGDFVDFREGVT